MSIISEKQVLGAILYDSDVIYLAQKHGITEKSFTTSANKHIWTIITGLSGKGKLFNSVDVGAGLDHNEHTYLMSLIDGLTTSAHAEYYIKETRQDERKAACLDIMAKGVEGKPIDEVIEELVRANSPEDIPIYQMKDLREDKIAQWKLAKTSGFVGVPFFITGINKYLGGWRKGCLAIIGGYRGEGKSILLREDAYTDAKAGRPVLFFSLEDPADIACASIAGLHSEVSTFYCDTGEAYPEQLAKIEDGWKEIDNLPLWLISRNINITQICALSEMMSIRHKIEVIYLDHIQYISPLVMQGMNRTQTLAHYSLTLSSLAKKLDVPIVVASQLSRDSEKDNRKPRLSDLRDSGCLEQDARQVLLLFWDGEKCHHVLSVAKNNYGISGKEVDVWRIDGKQHFSEYEITKKEDGR
jgi:replicative DNA helicase